MLDGSDAWTLVTGSLRPDHFSEPLHARIYAAIVDMAAKGIVSPIVLKSKLDGDEALSQVGGFGYIAGLIRNAAPSIAIGSHSHLIRELADRRRVIASCTDAIERAGDTSDSDFRVNLSQHLEEVTGIFDGAHERKTCFTLAEASANAIARLKRLRAGEPDPNAIPTYLKALDAATGGLRRGEYVVIGARPSMGKTALAVQLAMNVAEHGGGVAYFSLEMPEALLSPRILASRLWQPGRPCPSYQGLLRGEISESEAYYAAQAAEEMKDWPLLIEDEPGLTATEIEARARVIGAKLKSTGKTLDLVIVDHIHKMRHPGAQSKVSEYTEISARLAEAAKRLNCPVIALAQLNRAVEGRDDKRPSLADVRELGAIEQDADVVAFIYREAYYLERQRCRNVEDEADRIGDLMRYKNRMELILAKQRSGPISTVNLSCDMGSNVIRDPNEVVA